MHKSILLLKPQLLLRRSLHQALKLVEDQGFVIDDLYSLRMGMEDLVGFYELLVEIPDSVELESFAGLCVVLSLVHPNFDRLGAPDPFERKVPCKFVSDVDGRLTSYWFGRT